MTPFPALRKLHRLSWHLVLVAVLLLMQQAGVRHSFEHRADEDAAPSHAACLLCMAHHAQGHALSGDVPTMATPTLHHVQQAAALHARRDGSIVAAYQPRAPPPVFSA
ncbi:MAG: hypothetical protein QM742_07720 [Aquabacterium sp.]